MSFASKTTQRIFFSVTNILRLTTICYKTEFSVVCNKNTRGTYVIGSCRFVLYVVFPKEFDFSFPNTSVLHYTFTLYKKKKNDKFLDSRQCMYSTPGFCLVL